MRLDQVSIGLPGATRAKVIRALAPEIEAAGFRGLWINDTPLGDSLAGLAAAAAVTTTLQLATGVIPLDRRSAASIASRIGDLPSERLTIGIGAGGPKGALARVSAGVDTLKAATSAAVVVGALGPKMRALGAQRAYGILLNWLTPDAVREAMADLHRDAAGRPVRGALYARTIVADAARPALEKEAAGYQSSTSYAANFARLGISAIDATIDGRQPGALERRVSEYLASVDELVLRVVTGATTLSSYQRFIEVVAKA
jgi:alkanesulfonate monooxygenase SsuD/methylene tetrahydromethanopterin reductase-like flavin-dependent oxidoreductase (luciferase family)